MPKTREFTSQVKQIENRRDWFGEEDYELQAIYFMLASRYGINKLSLFCGRNSALFSNAALRQTVKALIWLWQEHKIAVCEAQDIDQVLELIDSTFFTQIKDGVQREEARQLLREMVETTTDDLHLYQDAEQVDIVVEVLKLAFQHEQLYQLQTALVDADNTSTTPQEYRDAAVKALERVNLAPIMEVNDTDFGEDEECLRRAFAQTRQPIIRLSSKLGPLAQVLSQQLVPTGFIAFMGPEKRGKSWMLQELALQSIRSGNETLFIQCGDMSKEEVTMRLATRLTQRNPEESYCGELYLPVLDCIRNQRNECNRNKRTGQCGLYSEKKKKKLRGSEKKSETQEQLSPQDFIKNNPDYIPCAECSRNNDRAWIPAYWWEVQNPVNPLDFESAHEALIRFKRKNPAKFKIVEYPSDTLTVSELSVMLANYKSTANFFPTVLVLDYMDLLASDKHNSKDYRHFQNELWKSMRGLAQKEELLIITATQANIGAQNADYIDMVHISEDKRKSAHVTAMWGLNQTKQEKEYGIMRLNQIVARSGRFDTRQQFVVLQCLERGNPMLAGYISPNFSQMA